MIEELIKLGINEKLKQAKNIDDLREIEKKIEELYSIDIYLSFFMKKTGYEAFDFTPYNYSNERVHYLINDGVSEGRSLVKNLHRNIKIDY